MKSILTITALILFFSFQTISQVIKQKEVFYEKYILEGLKEIHKSDFDGLKRLYNKETFPFRLNSRQVTHLFNNQQIEFYEEKELDGNHLITTITKRQLGTGFLLIESLNQTWSGSAWVNNSRILYTYDGNNNQIEYLYQTWSGSAWMNDSRYSYLYDGQNNPIELVFQTWSGGVWANNSKYLYTYDGNNNQIEYLYQTWSGSDWVNNSRYFLAYDGNNNPIEYLFQTWSGSAWVNEAKYLYTYNGNNNQIESLYQTWDGNVWINISRYFYFYDGNNNQIESLYQTWDGVVWVNNSKYDYSYDGNNNQIESLYQTWLGSAWENNSRYFYFYDGNNNRIESIYQTWDGEVWENNSRYFYFYDGNNNQIESLYQTWSGGAWVNNSKYDYSYDGNNNLIESLYQTWGGSAWANNSKYVYSYDGNNNQIESLYQTWGGSAWINSDRSIFTYLPEVPVELVSFNAELINENVVLNWSTATETNNNGFQVEKALSSTTPLQEWKSIGFISGKGTTTERTFYSFTDKNNKPGTYLYRLKQTDFDGTFNYSNEIEFEVSAPKDFALYQNYPNPFNPSTKIKFALPVKTNLTLSVFNTLGEKVAEIFNGEMEEGYHEMMFNASGLSSGIYFYKIESENFNSTKKMTLIK